MPIVDDEEEESLALELARRRAELLYDVSPGGQILQRLLDSLLELHQIQEGTLRVQAVDFDLCELVHRVADRHVARARAKGLRLERAVSDAIPALVEGDPGRIAQVLTHLLSNAIKFTASGEISLAASIDESSAAECTARVSVRDTGTGVADNPFRNVGAGLAICRQLVDLMGGRIGVDSQLGKGATFWFTIHLPKSTRATAPGITH